MTPKLSGLRKLLLSLNFCGSGIQAWGSWVLPFRVSNKAMIKVLAEFAVIRRFNRAGYASL